MVVRYVTVMSIQAPACASVWVCSVCTCIFVPFCGCACMCACVLESPGACSCLSVDTYA